MKKIISLGWGVQSFGMAAMSALGDLPQVDYAIHADTGFERLHTRTFAARWTPWLENHGIRVITVYPSSASQSFQKYIWMPVYTLKISDGSFGILKRQCTDKWKIRPIQKWIRENIGERVEKWIGFSQDEQRRMRLRDTKWGKIVYPLVEYARHPFCRAEIIEYLKARNIEVPGKSSCIICPFHSHDEWQDIHECPEEWRIATEMERHIRLMRSGYACYLHQDRKPLAVIKFNQDRQLEMVEVREKR